MIINNEEDEEEPLGVEGDSSGELPEERSSAHPEISASLCLVSEIL